MILAEATSKELEKIEQSVDQLSEISKGLIDKAVSFGISLLAAFIIFIVGRFVIKKVLGILDKVLDKSQIDIGVVKFINSVLKIVLYIILVVIICGQVGIETTSFAAILASGGLAIGLAFEGSLSNFAGGVLILVMKPFVVGDYIAVNGEEGTVEKIEIFYTSLTTTDNKSIKLPNGVLSNSVLVNYSTNDTRRVDVAIGIHYDDNIAVAKSILTDLMMSYENILTDHDNKVVVTGYGESSVDLQIRMWVATENYWDAKFYLHDNISDRFSSAGITIPYNQLDVRVIQENK